MLLTREGIIRGSSDQREEPQILGRRILEEPSFPDSEATSLNAANLPINKNPLVDRRASTDFGAFELPQLLIKRSILKSVGRFQAQLVESTSDEPGVICTGSYMSVHQFDGKENWLQSACLAFKSRLAAYFLALRSRLAYDRAEARGDHMLDVPLPQIDGTVVHDDFDVDELVEDAFQLKEPERALISDLLEFGYREGASKSSEKPSRRQTVRSTEEHSDDLLRYADFFIKTLRATFGKDRAVRATVFEEAAGETRLPVRMVAIHLDWPGRRRLLKKEVLQTDQLRAELARFYEKQLTTRTRDGQPITSGLGFRRVARIFVTHESDDGTKVPTVLYVKPDQRRYWTRSQGLRDADELAAAIITDRQQRMAAK